MRVIIGNYGSRDNCAGNSKATRAVYWSSIGVHSQYGHTGSRSNEEAQTLVSTIIVERRATLPVVSLPVAACNIMWWEGTNIPTHIYWSTCMIIYIYI
jgi:hypothetical protein